MKKELGEIVADKGKLNKGRPRKLAPHNERNLLQQIGVCRQQMINLTIRRLRFMGGTPVDVSNETVRRLLHRNGYGYKHAAKNWLDASMIKRNFKTTERQNDLWTKGI